MKKQIGPAAVAVAVIILLAGGWLYWNHLSYDKPIVSSHSGTQFSGMQIRSDQPDTAVPTARKHRLPARMIPMGEPVEKPEPQVPE